MYPNLATSITHTRSRAHLTSYPQCIQPIMNLV